MSQLTSARMTALMLFLEATAAAPIPSPAGSSCQSDINVLKTSCYKYVEDSPTMPPSHECCNALKGVDVPCVCSYLASPGIRENISLEKVFYISKQCAVSIPGNCRDEQLDLLNSTCTN